MKRRLFLKGLTGAAAAVLVAGPALAASYADDVVTQLTALGFTNIVVETTWLGRVRILAKRNNGLREIVLNPRTGEILRDVWSPGSASGARRVVLDDVDDDGDDDSSGHGSGGSDDDDNSGSDDDNSGHGGDDSSDDDSDDDNSGKDDSGKDDSGKDDSGKDD